MSGLPSDVAHRAIDDYAVIGDCRSAALVSIQGSIDWLCLPRFDSPAVFSAILDPAAGGRFQVRPVEAATSRRRYVGDSNVLETTFRTPTGVLRLIDLMPVDSEAGKNRELWPDHEVLRKLECLEGWVDVEVTFDPRFDYGRVTPPLERRGPGLYCAEHRSGAVTLSTDVFLEPGGARRGLTARVRMNAGNRRYLSLTYAEGTPAVIAPLGEHAEGRIDRSVGWWNDWASACSYHGPYRDSVVRSALVLKLLSYSPSGAIVAAPTTSLPERIGGTRNWDYRYCWLRDASLTLRALSDLGFEIEAESFLSWLLHATRLTWPQPRVLYDVYGESPSPERELHQLSGYANSRPVRVGNLAAAQVQLDVYGELIEAAFVWITRGGSLDRASKSNLVELGETVCRRWREPDHGIWERRTERRLHTHSRVMCWVALDRLLKLHDAGHVRVPVSRFTAECDAIRTTVEEHGYNARLETYTSVLDGEDVDASLLMLALHGYANPAGSRMRSTCDRIRQRLGVDGLLYRYVESDGLPPGEGAFGICGFWDAECRAMQGDHAAAVAQFEQLLRHQNDVGLFGEEIDPATGAALGNFPQGLTHVGLINAALKLQGDAA